MESVPVYVHLVFGLLTLLTAWLFFHAAQKSQLTLIILGAWLGVQSAVSLTGFYTVADTLPPRCVLLFWPPLLLIAGLFLLPAGRQYLDRLDMRYLTLMHTVRIPLALVFFWLFRGKAIPELLTLQGRNFDLLAGLSAPVVYYFGFVRRRLGAMTVVIWNLISLGLLLNLVVNAILSGPFRFQVFGFEQPTVAFLYFPFTWMVCGVAPLLILAHVGTIWHLRATKKWGRDDR